MPPSISVFAPAASRAARMRPTSAITSSGVFLRLARLCAWLADSGTSRTSAPLSRARSAPFRFGTRTETTRSGQRLRVRDQLGGVGELRQEPAPERTSRPRSRAGRRACAARIQAFLRSVGSTVRMLCSPSRRPTSRTTTRSGKLGMRARLRSGRRSKRRHRRHSRRSAEPAPVVFQNPRVSGMERHRRSSAACATSTSRRFACSSRSPTAARWRAPPSRSTSSRRRSASASPSSRTTSASSCWCAAAAACRRRRPDSRLLEHARSVLFTMDRIVADAASFAGGVQGHVRLIATASAIAEALLDDIAVVHARARQRAHQGRHRGAHSRATSSARCATATRRSASAGTTSTSRACAHRPYRRDRLALAVYAGHALAGRASIGFEETLDFEHVGLPPSTAVHTMLQRAAARRRPDRHVPRRRLRLRRGAARRRRQPRRQRRAARGRPAQRRRRRRRADPDRRCLGRAQLRDLLSRARGAAAGEPAARRAPAARAADAEAAT